MSKLLIQICGVLAMALGPGLHLLQSQRLAAGDLVLVVRGFHKSADEIIKAAGLRVIGPEAARMASFTQIEFGTDVAVLKAAGAVLVVDGKKVLALCS